MAMAAKNTLLLLVTILAATFLAEAAPSTLPPGWTNAEKVKAVLDEKTRKAFDGVMLSTPPEKQKEALDAVLEQQLAVVVSLAKAQASGDEKNYVSVAGAYARAADAVGAAAPADKLRAMGFAFDAVVAPDPAKCPAVDKPFCEAYGKVDKALDGVIAAGDTPKQRLTNTDAVLKQRLATDAAINKAYADDDAKGIAEVLAAYSKAADAVAAAAPPEKLKVMEETFSKVAAADHPAAGADAGAGAASTGPQKLNKV